jgi:hypothetical protein
MNLIFIRIIKQQWKETVITQEFNTLTVKQHTDSIN